LGAQAHADLPFDVLVDALRPERSLGHNPLFQVMYNHQRMEAATRQALESLRMAPFPRDGRSTQFDLILDTVETADGKLSGVFTYATDLFDADTIERLSRHFRILLAAVIAVSRVPVGYLLDETDEDLDAELRLLRLVRRLADRVPQRVENPCCVSGVKGSGVVEPRGADVEFSIDRTGGDYRNMDVKPDASFGGLLRLELAVTPPRPRPG